MRSRILFVDDEPLMREYYSTLGAVLEKDYEVFTAASGQEGLEFLTNTPVDIVVSDLVMPEMDGHEFMTRVAREHPESMRIVISAYDDQLTVAQCLMFGHRYFNKRIDLANLATILKRIGRLKHQVGTAKLKKVISGLGTLPTVPRLYFQLTEALNSPFSSLQEMADIVQQDVGLTVKLLQIANSAYFGMARRIITPLEAVQVIGIEVLRGIVLCVHAFKFYEERSIRSLSATELWNHSLLTAHGARKLAEFENLPREQCDAAFISGLLHDIGKLIMAANADADYLQVVQRSRSEEIPIFQAELEVFGATHAQVGAYLLGLWGLPEAVVDTIEQHHSLDTITTPGFSAMTAVHVAQALEPANPRASRLDMTYLRKIGVENRVEHWQRILLN
jgi:putative nucleotidyltransferase with HDIG domain